MLKDYRDLKIWQKKKDTDFMSPVRLIPPQPEIEG